MTEQPDIPSSADEVPAGFHRERWVYLGETANSGGKRSASFRDENGTTWSIAWGRDHSSLATGYIYGVLVSETAVRRAYTWTGAKADDFDDIRMQDRQRASSREVERLQAKARKGDPDLDRLLDHVNEYAARLVKVSSRDALITLLTRKVYAAHR